MVPDVHPSRPDDARQVEAMMREKAFVFDRNDRMNENRGNPREIDEQPLFALSLSAV